MVKFLPSKQRRKIWLRSLSGFWQEYKHNKIGLVGLAFLLLFVFVAIFSPWIMPYDPTATGLAEDYAIPEWMTIFPGYRNLPRTMDIPLKWEVREKLPNSMTALETHENLTVRYEGTTLQVANFTASFWYPYTPPDRFKLIFYWGTTNVENAQWSIELFIINPTQNKYILWTSYDTPEVEFKATNKPIQRKHLRSGIEFLQDHVVERLALPTGVRLVRDLVFTEIGEYKFWLQIKVKPAFGGLGNATIHVREARFKVLGHVHGLLGATDEGEDVFSQLIFGSRISLAVGLSAAFLATSIGIIVGVISGYIGGIVDEATMRIVDILLALPVLPLLLGLIRIFQFQFKIWYLVLLIAIFGWLGLSRLIRSSVLSLKEMPYIECARAAGASNLYIMRKHIIPNILPVALAALVLGVPAAILTEAGISFIGIYEPLTPTWGRMLNWAFSSGAFSRLAWWWILPPGLAITLITLSFVFVGHAVDEVVNPRLRRRR